MYTYCIHIYTYMHIYAVTLSATGKTLSPKPPEPRPWGALNAAHGVRSRPVLAHNDHLECRLMFTRYPLVNVFITIENHNLYWENPLYMAMFNSYVSLPEGSSTCRCRWRYEYLVEGGPVCSLFVGSVIAANYVDLLLPCLFLRRYVQSRKSIH